MVADRQITYDVSSVRTDIEKIERVDFQNFPALVAVVHDVDNAFRFIDRLRREGAKIAPSSSEEVGLLAQRIMFQLREEFANSFAGDKRTLNQIIEDENADCIMTIAFFINDQPEVIKLSLLRPRYTPCRGKFETEGCGGTLADYLLSEMYYDGMDRETATVTAVYAAKLVTKYDSMCRGPLTIAIAGRSGGLAVNQRSVAFTFTDGQVADMEKMAEQIYAVTAESRREAMWAEFQKREVEYRRMIERYARAWEESPLSKQPPDTPDIDDFPPGITQDEWERR